MPAFKFKGKNKIGNIVEGTRIAKSSAEFRQHWKKNRFNASC